MDSGGIIQAIQEALGVEADGRAGPETWGAIYAALVRPAIAGKPPAEAIAAVDARSERNIATLLPQVRPVARTLVQQAAAIGIEIKVVDGTRSYAEQDAMHAIGRRGRRGEAIVTRARGGQSSHNFGIAFDVGVFSGNRYMRESPKYKAVGAIGMAIGLEWGGNWTSALDQSHFCLRPRWAAGLRERDLMVQLRRRTQDGVPAFP